MALFGLNGVPLEDIDEFQLKVELTDREFETNVLSVLWLAGGLGFAVFASLQFEYRWLAEAAAILGFAGLIPSMVHYRDKAVESDDCQRLPRRLTAPRIHKHVSNFGALISLLLLCVMAFAFVAGQWFQPLRLQEGWGVATIFVLIMVIIALISAPKMANIAGLARLVSGGTGGARVLKWVAAVLATVDSWLVFIIAPAAGGAEEDMPKRYIIVGSNIGLAILFSCFGPAPIGLLGTAWAIMVVVAIVRRWAWIEKDRQDAITTPDLPVSQWRVGSKEDFRDEALAALLLLVLALPVGMRQIHLNFDALDTLAFRVPDGSADNPWAWLSFFGVELLKAIPFIDWSDIYGATNDTRIVAVGAIGMHTVFFARVIVDLVFIAAIVQAISISTMFARQKREFLAGNPQVRWLDERIERAEICRLALKTKDGWKFRPEIQKFTHYDEKRLSRLRLGAGKNERLRAALAEIMERAGYKFEPPQELLIDVSRDSRVDPSELHRALDAVRALDKSGLDLALLDIARKKLNWHGQIDQERQQLVRIIIDGIEPSEEKVETLSSILAGKGTERDSLATVRSLALSALQNLITRFPEAQQKVIAAARYDRAPSIRRRARQILEDANIPWKPQDVSKAAA